MKLHLIRYWQIYCTLATAILSLGIAWGVVVNRLDSLEVSVDKQGESIVRLEDGQKDLYNLLVERLAER